MKKIKIGILTFWSPINYGAYLQAYALSNRLNQEKDIDAEIIQFRMSKEVEFYRKYSKLEKNILRSWFNIKRERMFYCERKKMKLSNYYLESDSIEEFNKFIQGKYDVIVAGSDEIWKIDGIRGFPTPYFFFDGPEVRKFSYAASGRVSFNSISKCEQEKLYESFRRFEYIGVRDGATYDILSEIVDKKLLHFNLDPTFIYNFEPNKNNGYKLLKEKFGIDSNKKCIGVMYSEKKPSKPIIVKLIKSCRSDLEIVPLYQWCAGVKNVPNITPLEWIDIIAALDGMITMYFHAVCFCIITKTPFYAIESRAKEDEESKIYDLLKRFGLLEQYSLGLENAFESGKLIEFINTFERITWKKNSVIERADDEFLKFLECIRKEG